MYMGTFVRRTQTASLSIVHIADIHVIAYSMPNLIRIENGRRTT